MRDVQELWRRQNGVLRRDQAVARGMSTSTIDRRLADGDGEWVHPRAHRPASRDLDVYGRIRGAALWAGDGAVVVTRPRRDLRRLIVDPGLRCSLGPDPAAYWLVRPACGSDQPVGV